MISHISVSNTINKLFDNNSLLYLGQTNLFYQTLSDHPSYNLINNTDQPFIGVLHDDPLSFSQQSDITCLQYHSNSLVFIHNEAPQVLKKEDKHILSTKLKHTIKVFFSDAIRKSWGLSNDPNSYSITYGCLVATKQEKTNDVAVLNFGKNDIINNLYSHIKQAYPHTNMLTNLSDCDNMHHYRLVLSLENIYDSLYSAAAGCWVLSNHQINNMFPSIYKVIDYNRVNDQISQILSLTDSKIIETQNFIQQYLTMDQYYQNLNQIFALLKNRVYIYET
jgi:hypothetical protein